MEATSLIALISRLIKSNKEMNGFVKEISKDRDSSAIIKEFFNVSVSNRSNVISLSRQLALEQIKFIN